MQEIILASGSPRRRELLTREGIPFRVIVSHADEHISETDPNAYVETLAKRKAESVAENVNGDAVILGADTIVCVDREILGKPADEEEAKAMIRKIRGRAHEVVTGVALIRKRGEETEERVFSCTTYVHVRPMTEEEVEAYIAVGESMDKAGAYAIQGAFGAYIDRFEGDYDNVIGLPVTAVKEALKEWELK